MYSEIIVQKLKIARQEIGYTQRQVAERTGIHHITLAKIESGARMPDVETLGKLAELYEVSFDWLFGVGKKREENVLPKRQKKQEKGVS